MSTQNTELKLNESRPADQTRQGATQQVVTHLDQLADLQINDQQAAEVKGGPLLFTAVVTKHGTEMVMLPG